MRRRKVRWRVRRSSKVEGEEERSGVEGEKEEE